jgi:thiol-disulfide isomerase/thioredoxin
MKIAAASILLLAASCFAQTTGNMLSVEEAQQHADLLQVMQEAGGSQIEVIRGLELHLKKYPETKQRPEIEQALVKAAMESNDNERIILYGEKVLARQTPPDTSSDTPQILDRLIRALIDKEDKERAKRAVVYAERYQTDLAEARAKTPPGHLTPVQWAEELDKATARALALEARATGYAGDAEAAAKIARRSWEAHPTGEGARETAYWLSRLGRNEEAIEFYADAFTIEDARNTIDDRARDRAQLGTLYSKEHGSEKGLGDVVLQAYDRTSKVLADWQARLKAKDPNSVAKNLNEFTLAPVDKSAQPLGLAGLKGKTVVMDFWATWCAPCRAQKPMIENVQKHFADDPNVLFVAVNSDDDPALVPGFLAEQNWKDKGYYEGGLARQLAIAQIPTVLILDASGNVSSRMIGFIPERFEQMLTERVEEARHLNAH